VDPVQPARHPRAGLIEVRHLGDCQLLAHHLAEPLQPRRALGEHRGHRAGGQRCPQHVAQQLRGPVHRQVLVHQQIAASARTPGP
jgi:hypothetical protein